MTRLLLIVAGIGSVLCLMSCAARRQPILERPEVLHIVLVKLKNPGDAQELMKDTERTLGLSSATHALTPGVALDTPRPEVDRDYTVAFVMEFRDPGAYGEYLGSEAHKALVARWKPRIESLRAIDIQHARKSSMNRLAELKFDNREHGAPEVK